MPDKDQLILSRKTAEHLLEGISFFKENPAAKEWQNLDQDLFLFLCRELCQLPAEGEENLNDYLARLEDFLKKIINEELTAPSLPQNLEELVEAWENFSAQKDAHVLPPPKVNSPTVEDWIKTLKEKSAEEEVAPKIKAVLETAAPHLSSQDKTVLGEKISEEIAKTPFLTLPREEKEAVAQKVVEKSLGEKRILLGEEQRQALIKAMVEPAPTLPSRNQVAKEIEDRVESLVSRHLPSLSPDQKQLLARQLVEETIAPVIPPEEALLKPSLWLAKAPELKTPPEIAAKAEAIIETSVSQASEEQKEALKKEVGKIIRGEEKIGPATEKWQETFRQTLAREGIKPGVKAVLETAAPHLSSQDKTVLGEKISEEIAKTPFLTLPREEKEAVAQKVVEKSLGEKQILTPPVFKNFQEQIKETLKVSLGKVEPEIIKEISPIVTEALAVNLPFSAPKELASLNPSEKGEIVEKTIEAALPDIGEFLVAKGVNLSPQETANFLDQLTIATNDNLEKLTIVPLENRLPQEKIAKTEGSATPALAALLHPRQTATLIFNPQLGRNLEALDKNPSLPFSLAAEGEEASPGEKIKNIFLQKGINFQSVNLVKPLKEETESLILAAKGIKSGDIGAAIKAAQEENRPVEEIKKLEEIFSRQLGFEKKFPQLAQKFFRFREAKEIVSGQKNDQKLPSWPFTQIKSQTNLETIRWKILETANRFLAKIGLVKEEESPSGKTIQSSQIWYYPQKIFQTVASFWQKTGLGKTVKSWFSQQTHRFWQSALGQIKGFSKAGIKKAAREGAKKGVTKAITWLSTKLAATKLGATLGSIAPGVGNVVGAIVGLVIDVGLSLFKKGGEFLEKLTGGQTEAEQKLKTALGPFSFLVSPLVLIFIIALGAPLILVFLTVTNIGGAFLGPAGGEEAVPSLPSLPSLPPNIDNHLAESVIQIIRDCGYKDPDPEKYGTSYINKDNVDDIVACINASSLSDSQKDAIVSNFKTSVGDHTSLQCVGFAQAIADAQGIFLPDECGHAKGYINCPSIPSSRYTNEPSVGVFAVFGSGTWGHIGIITAVTANEDGIKRCRFASAGGNPDNSNGGDIDVVEYPCDSFDALIKPN